MANIYESMNVRQKLSKARLYFLNQKVTKSGINMHLEFKYFELEDIVPTAIRIFARIGLVTEVNFYEDQAVMAIYNADNLDEEAIKFSVPYREIKPIVSNSGKMVTNELQTLGSSITYLRRYLWMMALDITEPDNVDATLGEETEEPTEIASPKKEEPKQSPKKEKKQSAPATPVEREEAKTELTNTDGQADALQLEALKKACKTLISKDASQEEFVQTIAMKTDGFTDVTREKCDKLIGKLTEILAQYEG